MSLQDDYFELSESLKGSQKEALDRIWETFCVMEEQQEDLLAIKRTVRDLVDLTFKEEIKFLEERLKLLDTNK